jgi:ABC-type multidrug transport system fused ATPase/permease subunit
MSVGAFAAFIGLLMAAGQSLRQVTNLQTVMTEGLTAARRLFAALDIQPEIREAPDAVPLARRRSPWRFDGQLRLCPGGGGRRPDPVRRVPDRRSRARPSPWSARQAAARAPS